MENVKVEKKKKRKRKSTWQKILEKEMALNELALFQETINSRMNQEAFLLERKRNYGKEYTT